MVRRREISWSLFSLFSFAGSLLPISSSSSFFQWRTQREKRESLDAKFDKIAANSVGSAYAVRSSRSLFFGSNSPFFGLLFLTLAMNN
jgi:phosphoglycerate-specific signal transduction histidine kinase